MAAKPTVLIVGYGMADSFDGAAGLPRFVEGLQARCSTCRADEGPGRPALADRPRRPGPALARPGLAQPRPRDLYMEAIRKVAEQRQVAVRRLLRAGSTGLVSEGVAAALHRQRHPPRRGTATGSSPMRSASGSGMRTILGMVGPS